ncbi:hypothetical protein [Anaeromicrobium sediminis]|uniref:Uncharacterized protein n=1 Tax=Anaeromicrobium sediminis TaxID=1478221 RepID=A0A267MHJ4_9FIRM|nr:hypothetical protein [Anaeromicrobium sediminis]PAB58996.1 hypothetical protein CCE28_12495 [Anaeromicrobium sediminis]
MFEKYKEKVLLGFGLLGLSLILYTLHYLAFRDMHHILVFSFEHVAFIPIEVLLVTLIIEGAIERKEKMKIMEKLNTLIGLFFSELGLKVLKDFISADPNIDKIRERLIIYKDSEDEIFKELKTLADDYEYDVDVEKINFLELKEFLNSHRNFLMGMMQNPYLLEHDTFTDLLKAVFHLQEELNFRSSMNEIKEKDKEHLKGDVIRIYKLITYEWVVYMEYLKTEYPFMYATALMNNPFDKRSVDEIERQIYK